MGKNISESLRSKYSPGMLAMCQKLHDHAKQSAFKTASKSVIQKSAEATCDLNGNKIANKITKSPKYPQENNSETVINEHDKEIPKEKYISPEERQEIIDELRLKQYNNGISKSHKKNNSATVTNENDKEMAKEISKVRYMFLEDRKLLIM